MMRNLKLDVDLPSNVVDALEQTDGVAMIIAMQESKIAPFGTKLLKGVEAVEVMRRGLSTLQQLLESDGDRDSKIRKTLEMMVPVATAAVAMLDDVKVIIGSAVFVRNSDEPGGDKSGRLQ